MEMQRVQNSMAAPSLLRRFLERLCPHRFSWPHTGLHGQHYQVCLICGAAYEYDWSSMSRTGRLVEPIDTRYEAAPKH